MNIRVLFFSRLRVIFGESERWVRVSEGTSVHELVKALNPESEDILLNKIPLIYAVNENFDGGDKILKDKDVLAIMTPLSGG